MSAYAKLPSDDDAREGAPVSKLDATLGKAGKVARNVVGEGLRGTSAMLDDPRAGDIDSLLKQGDLPGIDGDRPLRELLRRLDAEADLWRGLAFRELAQTRSNTRLLRVVAIVVVVAELGLAAAAALGAAFGGSGTGARRSLILGAGSISLILALIAFAIVAHLARKGENEVMREALARADLAELRLHRITLALASIDAEPQKAGETLARLEAEARR
jgi:hypothetical protein